MHPALLPLLGAASSAASDHVSLTGLLGRLVLSLLVVLGVLWALAQLVRRKGMPGSTRPLGSRARGRTRPIDVITRQTLGKGQALVAVRVTGRVLLLGVTSQSITTLAELDPDGDEQGTGTADTTTVDRTSFRDWSNLDAWSEGSDQSVGGGWPSDRGREARSSGRTASVFRDPRPGSQAMSWSDRVEQWRGLTVRR